jgi:heterodisulfide reductase subunit B2
VPEVEIFNEAFMREIRLWGRAYELGLLAEMKLRTRDIKSDIDLGIKMLRKGKLAFIPNGRARPVRPGPYPAPPRPSPITPAAPSIPRQPNSIARHRLSATHWAWSLVEPRGWVCCGSSAAHRSDPEAALRLPATNLALIEQSGFPEVAMPCAACFNRHKAAQHEMRHNSEHKAAVDKALGYEYQDTVRVSTLVDALLHHVGEAAITARVQKPLAGLRVVAYYGCLLTRPPQVTEAPHPENPTDMDDLLEVLGADVVDWSYKTVCCGAAHSLTRPDIVLKLSGDLIGHAREVGADVIAVACPLCHTNLDARQFQMGLEAPMPVLYFTQLMALALGLPEKDAAFDKNLVDPRPLLQEKGFLDVR